MIPASRSAVNVLMNSDSPPRTARFSPLSAPPFVDVCMSMPSVMLTMAPDSAWMVSPLESERTASE